MVAPTSDRRLGQGAALKVMREFTAISQFGKQRMCALGLLFRLILWSCCLLTGLPLQAQEGEGHATLDHPPQDQWLHEKFYSTWHIPDNPSASCCMVAITHDR
jgi:hypothetical protein